MKNNFTQALKELTGFDGEPNQVESSAEETQSVKGKEAVADVSTIPSIEIEPNVNQDVVTFKEFCDKPSNSSTHVTPNMVIKGNITSKDDIFVNGDIIGNVQTTESINVTKLILGNVAAQNMFMDAARLRGDLEIETDLIVGQGSIIVGNISCENVKISGKVKGNCDIRSTARMTSGAYLAGDICVDDLTTEQGARIQGKVSTKTAATELDSDFDFGGEF